MEIPDELKPCVDLIYQGNFIEASYRLDEYLRIYPYNIFALDKKGQTLMLMHHYSESLKYVDMCISANFCYKHKIPSSQFKFQIGESLNNRSRVLLQLRKPKDALKTLQKQFILYPMDVDAITGIGFAYYQLKKYSLALKYADKAMSINPQDLDALELKKDILQKIPSKDINKNEKENLPLYNDPNKSEFYDELGVKMTPCAKIEETYEKLNSHPPKSKPSSYFNRKKNAIVIAIMFVISFSLDSVIAYFNNGLYLLIFTGTWFIVYVIISPIKYLRYKRKIKKHSDCQHIFLNPPKLGKPTKCDICGFIPDQ
ncbi:MAG: tetratricopeptide repeat protein [Nitrosopumilus sp.]|nr:tetratricopeptide repeat protein [Nitrosopumilus sp.]